LLVINSDIGYPILQTTKAGVELCRTGGKVRLSTVIGKKDKSIPEKIKKKSKKLEIEWEGVNNDLYKELRQLRKTISERIHKPPYMVFSDDTLRELARNKPTNKEEFAEIKGVGSYKLGKYSEEFLQLLNR